MSLARLVWLVAMLLIPACARLPVEAAVGKAHQILIDRGLQVQGLVATYDTFHLSTYSNANYTAVIWLWDPPRSYNLISSHIGAAPGFPWARWVGDEADMPPLGSESGYLSQLVNLQLADEWHLDNDATRTRAVNWFNSVRSNWPNTILSANNWGGQVTDANMIDFITRAQPDMICFDTYPWKCVYDASAPAHIGPPIGGPPTTWYSHLRTYRDISRAFNIPFGSYVQTFHAVEEYGAYNVYRDPSPSELRLNHFGALAFNAKMLIDFLYNNGSSSLFNSPGGDSNPNALYYEKADCALRARNFGKALVRLKPIDEATSQWTTSIVFVRGKNAAGTLNPIPINFYAGPAGTNPNTDWVADRNDPWLRGWEVTNVGTRNNGQPGDVTISWFKLLDESFDGPDYTAETYFMVVNGLTETNGTAADCAQEVKLNFLNTFTAVEAVDPLTGTAQAQVLPIVSTRRQLTLRLNGGDAALFKIATGAPFVGVPAGGPPVITKEPLSRTNIAGSDAVFSVSAAGLAPLAYAWRFNGAQIGGASTSTYTRTNAQAADAGQYSVVVSNSLWSTTSLVAILTVHLPPQITEHPQSQTVFAGANVAFSAAAAGIPAPGWQWRFNGVDVPGATAGSFTRTNVQVADAGNYSVLASNLVGAEPSSNAVLTVNGPPVITAQPRNQFAVPGGSARFAVSAAGTSPLTCEWRLNGQRLYDGPGVSGAATLTLMLSDVQAAGLGIYTVAVSNAYGGELSREAVLAFAGQPTIHAHPMSATNNSGDAVMFEVVASGGGLTYQWQRGQAVLADTGNINGAATDLLSLLPANQSDVGTYTVIITNVAGAVTSSPATLTLTYQLPFREPFNYTAGANLGGLMGPSSVTWADVGTSTEGPCITVRSNNLTSPGLLAAFGNSIRFGGLGKSARLSFPGTYTSGTIYYSFTLKIVDLTGATTSGGFIAGFNNSKGTQTSQPSVVAPRLYVRTTAGGFNLGVAKNSSTSTDWVWDPGVFSVNQTIFVVGSYAFSTVTDGTDDVCSLWIDPDPAAFGAAEPPTAALTAASGSDIANNQVASFVFFQRSAVNEPAVMVADELRVATTWAGVTPRASQVRIGEVTLASEGRIRLKGKGDPGNYTVECSPDLVNWEELFSLASATGDFLYAESIDFGTQRFYRAVLSTLQ